MTKSEISKSITDAFVFGNAYIADFADDMAQVAAIVDRDFTALPHLFGCVATDLHTGLLHRSTRAEYGSAYRAAAAAARAAAAKGSTK